MRRDDSDTEPVPLVDDNPMNLQVLKWIRLHVQATSLPQATLAEVIDE